jgi:hypothetical protein
MTISNTLKNSTSYGADVLHYAKLKGEQDSGPLFFALAYHETMIDLATKIDHAKANGDKVRSVILEHWFATPEGDEVNKEYAALLAIKNRSPDQEVHKNTLHNVRNQVYTQTERNVDTCKGVDLLRADGRQVNIVRIQGTNKYACYVVDSNSGEFINVSFTATQLRKLAAFKPADIQGKVTGDVRKMADSLKQGAANVDKGGVEGIARADLGKTAKALDAAISGTIIDGKLEGVSGPTRAEVMMLWARLDAELNDVEKAKARLEFAKLAASPEQVAATAKADNLKAAIKSSLKPKAAKATAA